MLLPHVQSAFERARSAQGDEYGRPGRPRYHLQQSGVHLGFDMPAYSILAFVDVNNKTRKILCPNAIAGNPSSYNIRNMRSF